MKRILLILFLGCFTFTVLLFSVPFKQASAAAAAHSPGCYNIVKQSESCPSGYKSASDQNGVAVQPTKYCYLVNTVTAENPNGSSTSTSYTNVSCIDLSTKVSASQTTGPSATTGESFNYGTNPDSNGLLICETSSGGSCNSLDITYFQQNSLGSDTFSFNGTNDNGIGAAQIKVSSGDCSQGIYSQSGYSDSTVTIGNVALVQDQGLNCTVPTSAATLYCADGTQPNNVGMCDDGSQPTTKAPAAGTSDTTSCESTGGPFSWFICAAVDTLNSVESQIIGIVQELLTTNPINFNANPNCSDPKTNSSCTAGDKISAVTYQVWSQFRVYGDILLVVALLAAIIIEAAGGGSIAEAYTVKRMLPRILVAAILINLSIYIVAGLEDIVNILGNGIQTLLQGPFHALGAFKITVSGGTGLLATLGVGGIAAFAGFTEGIAGIALLVLSMFVLAALGVLITVMIRQGLIVVLVLVSPVAFALYCLPNTEQYFRKWFDLLIKTLLVYPIVMAILAVSSIAAVVMSEFPITPAILSQLMAILAACAPLFLIPFAFRMSGGVIGQASKAIKGAQDRVREPIRNLRRQNRANRIERARNNNLFRGESALARGASALAQGVVLAPRAGLNPRRMRGRFAAARSTRTSAAAAKAGESEAASAVLSNDDLLNASLSGRGTEGDARTYLHNLGQRGTELEQNVASIIQARRDLGRDAFQDAAVVANAGTGTGYGSGPAEMLESINRVAGADRARAARLLAGARGQAERARRVDLYGAGFATSADQLSQLYTGNTNAAATNEVMTDEALLTKSAGEIASGRNNSLTNMQGSIIRRISTAQYAVNAAQSALASATAGGNPVAIATAQNTLETAQHEQKRIMAHTSAFLDVAGQVSAENSQLVGAILGNQYAAGTTIGQQIETLEGDQEFKQYKKVYGTATAAGAAGAGAVAGPGGPVGPPPVGPPPPPAAPAPSDMRLKTDIKYLAKLESGINIYSFRYVWGGPVYVGVMAQQVLHISPRAVSIGKNGYYYVNYKLLGIEMMTIDDWRSTKKSGLAQVADSQP